MEWTSFLEHPDFCWTVVRRRIGEELCDLFIWYLEIAATRGRSLTWSHAFPDRGRYNAATYRLRKSGLLVTRGRGHIGISADTPLLRSPAHKPDRFWRKKWNGYWYMLVYDVPEKERSYRDELRKFLVKRRMGCLQKSVWITPWDIRPEYDDMVKAAALGFYAQLFHVRTVLGQDPQRIVETSWDMDELRSGHEWFLDICERNTALVREGRLSQSGLENLAREELSAYLTVMEDDPLLPMELHPSGYLGCEVFNAHCELVREIAAHL